LAPSASAHTDTEALDAYAGAIKDAVGCFADNIGFRRASRDDPGIGGRGLTHGGVPFRLQARHGTPVVAVAVRLHYLPVQVSQSPRKWEIRTVQYIYEVHSIDAPPHEIAGYHWHPSVPGMGYPHCHAREGPPAMARLHLPTRFITLGSVFRWLMRDFGAAPLATNWAALLDAADKALEASLLWAINQERPAP
jgi:hypothetical protein